MPSFADIKEGIEVVNQMLLYNSFSHSHIVTFLYLPEILLTLVNFLEHFMLLSLPLLHCMHVLLSLHHFVILQMVIWMSIIASP